MLGHKGFLVIALCGAVAGPAVAQQQLAPEAAVDGEKPINALDTTSAQPPVTPAAPKPQPQPQRSFWTGEEVRATQQHLVRCGYLKRRPSTRWNRAAVRALREWQIAQGMEPNGRMSDQVWSYVVHTE